MKDALHLDFETRSRADLRDCGAHRYVLDATTDIWLARYSFGQGEPREWRPGQPVPDDLEAHIICGGNLTAHNASFERLVITYIAGPRYDWPVPDLEQYDCTMARAAAVALPQSLDHTPAAVGLSVRKDKEGHALMLRMARPRKVDKATGEVTWWDDPERLERLSQYCAQDVLTEIALDNTLPALSDGERRLWMLDQTINDRGVHLDIPTIGRLRALVEYGKRRLDDEMRALTDGAVPRCTASKALAEWITAAGIDCDSVAKDRIEPLRRAAAGDTDVLRALDLRAEGSKSSTAKLKTMLACAGEDGRARGQLNYHGATTGRWAGRLVQFQNLVRLDGERDLSGVGFLIDLLCSPRDIEHIHDTFEATYGSPVEWASRALRPMVTAASGNKLVGGDLSNIEGCVNAWLADERWKLDAYRAYQAGQGPDLYKVAYARSFGGTPDEVKGHRRQIGKVQELALGYQGGVNAFVSMGKNYRVNIDEIVPVVQAAAEPAVWYGTAERFDHAFDKGDFTREQWTALKVVVDGWRAGHRTIVQSWWDLQDAAIEAVSRPNEVVEVLNCRVKYLCARNFLWCQIPSGRVLAYSSPWIKTDRVLRVNKDGEEYERVEHRVLYMGFDNVKKIWGPQGLYGGKQCENIVQAIARDVLVEGMFAAEAAGYPIVLTVHDELLTEPPAHHGSADELERIMSTVPAWAPGLPLAAKCWEGPRYVK